jgi:hypothetical protein
MMLLMAIPSQNLSVVKAAPTLSKVLFKIGNIPLSPTTVAIRGKNGNISTGPSSPLSNRTIQQGTAQLGSFCLEGTGSGSKLGRPCIPCKPAEVLPGYNTRCPLFSNRSSLAQNASNITATIPANGSSVKTASGTSSVVNKVPLLNAGGVVAPPRSKLPGTAIGHVRPSSEARAYRFTLEYLTIVDTRSLHEDTNHATMGVSIDDQTTVKNSKDLGNENSGDHYIGLSVYPVVVPAGAHYIKFEYAIQNQGKGFDAAAFAKAAADLSLSPNDISSDHLSDLEKLITLGFPGLAPGGCDGLVAAAVPFPNVFYASFLMNLLPNIGSTLNYVQESPGYDSPYGCGSNSYYRVTYSITRIPLPS